MADEFEPGREFQRRIFEHSLEVLGGHIAGIADFVRIDFEIDVCLYEEDVVNYYKRSSLLVARDIYGGVQVMKKTCDSGGIETYRRRLDQLYTSRAICC